MGQSPRSGWFHRVCGSSRLRQNHNSPRCGRKHVQGAAGVLTAKLTIVAVQIKKMNDMNDMNDTEPLNFGALMEHSICGQSHFSSDRRTCLFIFSNPKLCIDILLSMFERWTRKKLAT